MVGDDETVSNGFVSNGFVSKGFVSTGIMSKGIVPTIIVKLTLNSQPRWLILHARPVAVSTLMIVSERMFVLTINAIAHDADLVVSPLRACLHDHGR